MEERTQVSDTVDGRNPTPVDMVDIPFCTGFRFTYPRWLAGFLRHQQYGKRWTYVGVLFISHDFLRLKRGSRRASKKSLQITRCRYPPRSFTSKRPWKYAFPIGKACLPTTIVKGLLLLNFWGCNLIWNLGSNFPLKICQTVFSGKKNLGRWNSGSVTRYLVWLIIHLLRHIREGWPSGC